MIHLTLEGPAEWRGGIAQGSAGSVQADTKAADSASLAATPVAPFLHDDNYVLSHNLPVEGGVNRVSVRSTTTQGTIEVVAESDALTPARVTLITQAVETQKDGTSPFDPASDLPLHLERGPTPRGPSFVATRREVPIIGATAGTNAAEAVKSYDGNETTSWTNASVVPRDIDSDGLPIKHVEADARPVAATLEDAWIEYKFAQPVVPIAVELKLGSFRLRHYPLRISLDGQVVYKGLTPTSLGYVTLPLRAARAGTKMRVELTGLPTDLEETHALVEVNGNIDQAESRGRAAKPILSILEADVYASP